MSLGNLDLLFFKRFAASRSGDEPRPSLHKYKQNFELITFPISDKSRASPFLETAVGGSFYFSFILLIAFSVEFTLAKYLLIMISVFLSFFSVFFKVETKKS